MLKSEFVLVSFYYLLYSYLSIAYASARRTIRHPNGNSYYYLSLDFTNKLNAVVGYYCTGIYTVPDLASPSAKSNLLTTGANHDTLYTVGWLDLKEKPQVLHVPDMNGRYYSIQFTDPKDGSDFAYVGRRTTGTEAGDYLVTGPGWSGSVPPGMKQISSPNNRVLIIGRVLVENDDDLATASSLSKQITLTPLGS
jgi:hypothetical protein